ncbi:unnamed protein product [Closterium sp. NIES-64]|nr:unnamed protein product [Closterium sp. NIES-64]
MANLRPAADTAVSTDRHWSTSASPSLDASASSSLPTPSTATNNTEIRLPLYAATTHTSGLLGLHLPTPTHAEPLPARRRKERLFRAGDLGETATSRVDFAKRSLSQHDQQQPQQQAQLPWQTEAKVFHRHSAGSAVAVHSRAFASATAAATATATASTTATPSGSPGVLRGDDVEFDIDFHLHELPSRSRHATSATGARYAATDVTSAGEWREVAELKLALGALVGRVTAELAKAGVAVGLGKSEVKAERRAERKVRLSPAVSRLVSGAVAGGVSRTATAPLETIRTHMICGRGGLAANGSMTAVFQWVLRTEGWTGLFRGNAINVLRVAPSKAIEMLTYDTVKRFLTPKEGRPSIIPRQLPIPISSIAGSSAGIASCLLTYPLELVKTRLTVNPDMYRGVLHAFHRIIMEQGVGELYRGVAPSVVGMIPYAGANFYAYDTLCTAYRKARGREEIEPLMTLVIGSTAGCFAAASTFPLEVARKHLQMGATGGRVAYTGMLQCMRSIVREQGVKGLYRGVVPSCAKMMPAAGISFMCYEVLKRVLIEDEKVR